MNFPVISETFLIALGKRIRSPKSGDQVDCFHYRYTVCLLLFFTVWVSLHQFKGDPILCWIPAEYKDLKDWVKFIYEYCYIQSTYYVPDEDPITDNSRTIGYYQWVPVILGLQAFMFYVPNFFWKSVNWGSGIQLGSILAEARKATDFTKISSKDRDNSLQKISNYLVECLDQQKSLGSSGSMLTKYNGRYVTLSYLFMKFICLANVILQFFLLSMFIGTNYPLWGFHVIHDLMRGREWRDTGQFPRITYCNYPYRKMAKTQIETVQCLLKINMLNEKIFIFLWAWFLFLAICTLANFLYWIWVIFLPYHRSKMVLRYLKVRQMTEEKKDRIDDFILNFLQLDGVLVLKFIRSQVGDLVAAQIAGFMWQEYRKSPLSGADLDPIAIGVQTKPKKGGGNSISFEPKTSVVKFPVDDFSNVENV